MASPQAIYPNSTAGAAKKTAPRLDLLSLIKTLKIKRGLRNTLAAWYEAARCPSRFQPLGTEILLFCANKGMEVNALVSERTARYHRRELEKLGIVDLIFGPNSRIRPGYHRDTSTHRLNVERLLQMQGQDYEAWKASRPLATRLRPLEIRKPPAAAAGPEDRRSIPEPARSGIQRREPAKRTAPALTVRQRRELVKRIAWLVKGRTQLEYTSARVGMDLNLKPDDPRYKAPMKKHDATLEACRSMSETDGVSIERAIEAAREAGFDIQPKGNA